MKKLSLLKLNNAKEVLNNKQMKEITGGGTWTCYCGFVGGAYEDMTVQITASSTTNALSQMNCGGAGATCNGN